jgi:hypothetical protein
MSAFGTKRTSVFACECPLLGVKRTSTSAVEFHLPFMRKRQRIAVVIHNDRALARRPKLARWRSVTMPRAAAARRPTRIVKLIDHAKSTDAAHGCSALLNGEEAAIGGTATATRILGAPSSIIAGQSGGGCLRQHRWHHDERRAHLQASWSLLEHLYIRVLMVRHWPMVQLRKPGQKSKIRSRTRVLDGSF